MCRILDLPGTFYCVLGQVPRRRSCQAASTYSRPNSSARSAMSWASLSVSFWASIKRQFRSYKALE